MYKVEMNNEKNGIEVSFDSKPDCKVINGLKKNGFRWSNRQRMWYAKQTDEALAFAKSLAGLEKKQDTKKSGNGSHEEEIIDLWALTREESIEKREEGLMELREISAQVKKHIVKRFPMLKFSVTSKNDILRVSITSSPYKKDSEVMNAIRSYISAYSRSYQPCYRYYLYSASVSMDFSEKDEMSVSDRNIVKLFEQRKEEDRIARLEEFRKNEEERQRRYEEYKKQEEKDMQLISDNIKVDDCENFIVDGVLFNGSKYATIGEYMEGMRENPDHSYRRKCVVARKVYMTGDAFNTFCRYFLDDFGFLEGTGGSATDDERIQSMQDYYAMSREERETVEWYNDNCVAIYCDGKLRLVIDAQGYSYSRYVGFVDEFTSYDGDDVDEYAEQVETIKNISDDVISENGWTDTWKNENQITYIAKMAVKLKENGVTISDEAIDRIDDEMFQRLLFRIRDAMDSTWSQIRHAGLKEGQKITMIQMSNFGSVYAVHGTFESAELGKYAQYDDAVKLVYIAENGNVKRRRWIYEDVIICDGWIDIPVDLVCDVRITENGAEVREGKFTSFGNNQFDEVIKYLKENGITPIVNTYDTNFIRN